MTNKWQHLLTDRVLFHTIVCVFGVFLEMCPLTPFKESIQLEHEAKRLFRWFVAILWYSRLTLIF